MSYLQGLQRRLKPSWNRHRLGALIVLSAILWASGLGLVWWSAASIPELSNLGRTLRHDVQAVHGGMAWLLCMLVGNAVWPHVQRVFNLPLRRWQWYLGIVLLAVLAFVGLSGYLLLYGPASTQETTLLFHWIAGLIWPLPLVIHVWRGLRKMRA